MATRRSRLKKNLKKLLPAVTVTLTTVPFAVWSAPAQAFFPPAWSVPPVVTVVPPVAPPPLIVVPPVSPPPIVVPPPHQCPLPNGVPEPATVASALIGLAAVAGYRFRRKQ